MTSFASSTPESEAKKKRDRETVAGGGGRFDEGVRAVLVAWISQATGEETKKAQGDGETLGSLLGLAGPLDPGAIE